MLDGSNEVLALAAARCTWPRHSISDTDGEIARDIEAHRANCVAEYPRLEQLGIQGYYWLGFEMTRLLAINSGQTSSQCFDQGILYRMLAHASENNRGR